MIGHDYPPLTPEERARAQRLARLDASAAPSPALDARILTAARASSGAAAAAGAGAAAPHRRLRGHWPIGFGIAASLALAVGIAWQLRPLPGGRQTESPEAPSAAAMTAREAPVAADPQTADITPPSGSAMGEEEAAGLAAISTGQESRRQAAPEPVQAAPSAPAPAPESPPVVFDAPSPVAFPAPSPSPQPPPAAPPAPPPERSALSSTAAAQNAAQQAGSRERKAGTMTDTATPQSALQNESERLDRIETTGTHVRQNDDAFRDEPFDDEPPASADSPEVRKAWLARIRELVAEGRRDAARASLEEFRRRYPQEPLPDDLRPLLP